MKIVSKKCTGEKGETYLQRALLQRAREEKRIPGRRVIVSVSASYDVSFINRNEIKTPFSTLQKMAQ